MTVVSAEIQSKLSDMPRLRSRLAKISAEIDAQAQTIAAKALYNAARVVGRAAIAGTGTGGRGTAVWSGHMASNWRLKWRGGGEMRPPNQARRIQYTAALNNALAQIAADRAHGSGEAHKIAEAAFRAYEATSGDPSKRWLPEKYLSHYTGGKYPRNADGIRNYEVGVFNLDAEKMFKLAVSNAVRGGGKNMFGAWAQEFELINTEFYEGYTTRRARLVNRWPSQVSGLHNIGYRAINGELASAMDKLAKLAAVKLLEE